MTESLHNKWGLDECLDRFPLLSSFPRRGGGLVLRGRINEEVRVRTGEVYKLNYRVEILISPEFPEQYPIVSETEGKIAKGYHKLRYGNLCLGSPLRLRLMTTRGKTLSEFVKKILLPYLANHAAFVNGDELPFGELNHDELALLDDYKVLFELPDRVSAFQMLYLLSKSAYFAKNQPCPCGSQRKLRHCHQKIVARLRMNLSPADFKTAFERAKKEIESLTKNN